MSFSANSSQPKNAPNQTDGLRQAAPPRRPTKYRRRNRGDDPYVEVVRQLQTDSKNPDRRLPDCTSDCVNDEKCVCEHIHQAAVMFLLQTDAERLDWASFHESFPAKSSTRARHGSSEREQDLWQRIKHGTSTHHPGDSNPDADGTGQGQAVFFGYLRLAADMLGRGERFQAAINDYQEAMVSVGASEEEQEEGDDDADLD